MTPVLQTTTDDCLSACVASVLDMPISDVPYWGHLKGPEFIASLLEWSTSRGLGFVYMNMLDRESWPILSGLFVIVVGTTRRSSEFLHAIVAKAVSDIESMTTRLDFVHDPYRFGDFITDPEYIVFFTGGSK